MAFALLDPDAIHDFETPGFPGVVFKLKAIPYGRWMFLRNTMLLEFEKSERRAVQDLHAQGVDPEATIAPDTKVTYLRKRIAMDPAAEAAIFALNSEIVRWGLVGAEGLELRGKPLAFFTSKAIHEGQTFDVLDADTMHTITAQRGLVTILSNRLWTLNDLGPDEKKA